jgi:hypothetical protein
MPAVAEPVAVCNLRLLGTAVDVRTDLAVWADRLGSLLAPFVEPVPLAGPATTVVRVASLGGSRPGGRTAEVHGVDGSVVAVGAWPQVEAAVLAELNAVALDRYRGLAVHAGVVARPDRVVAFPGVSGAGKSTTTAACLRSGFAYVSDEALCLDPSDGSVVAYPRPIALSRRSCALLGLDPDDPADPPGSAPGGNAVDREVLLGPDALGASTAPARPGPLTDVVALQLGATTDHLEPLHRSHVVPLLLGHAFNHFKDPDAAVELVHRLAAEVGAWRLHVASPPAAAELLARELA